MKHFIFLAVFLYVTILAADVWENPAYIDAVKKYYETVDRAKLSYLRAVEVFAGKCYVSFGVCIRMLHRSISGVRCILVEYDFISRDVSLTPR